MLPSLQGTRSWQQGEIVRSGLTLGTSTFLERNELSHHRCRLMLPHFEILNKCQRGASRLRVELGVQRPKKLVAN